jgi:hypothetical protein
MLATKHQNVNAAILGRGDKGVSLSHLAHKTQGSQLLYKFASKADFQRLEDNELVMESTTILGYYTVQEAVWNLATAVVTYEEHLLADKKISDERTTNFSDQLIQRLIASSTNLTDPSGDLEEGHELWRLCLSGDVQEVFVPSDNASGGLSLLPGAVLADLSAPKGMPSVIARLIAKERESEQIKQQAYQDLRESLGSLVAGIYSKLLDSDPEEDDGHGRGFGIN